jgi:hypothetical protein
MKNNMINQLYESIFFSGLTALGLSLKNVGILQGLWKSKLIVLYTKTLIANLKLLTAKSVLLTYAPYIVPTVALSYGGYKLYMNVLNKSKKENKNVDEEDKKE